MAGLRISVQANPKALADSLVDPFPSTVDTPLPEIVVDGRPSRELVRKQAPPTAAPQEVEDGLKDLA